MSTIAVTASVHAENPEDVVRAMESLARAAAGMALEGLHVTISSFPLSDDD